MSRSVALLTLAVAALLAPGATADAAPATDRTVILITVDGFPAWMWHDPTTPVPHLRQLAAAGAEAEAMTVSNPSITWINHTTLITGVDPRKHGVLYNGLLVRGPAGQPPTLEVWRDKKDLVHVPTLYDAAHAAGLRTAQVDWVAILNSGTIDREFLELPKGDGPLEREMMAAGKLEPEDIRRFSGRANIAWRDMIWTRAAVHIIEQHHPNLLLFHLLTTDSLNHSYGPGSTASYAGYGYADALIGELIKAVEQAGLKDRTTYLVTTDHGFKKVRRTIDLNVALKDAGLLRLKGRAVADCDAYAMPEGGLAFVYVTDPAKRAAFLPQLKALCASVEGIDQVLDGSEAPSLGMPTPAENPGTGDLILFAKPGYAFLKNPEGNAVVIDATTYLGTHGYPATDPELDGIFFASGKGIKPGTKLGRVRNLDVAPTAARLLGLEMKDVEGRVLSEALLPP